MLNDYLPRTRYVVVLKCLSFPTLLQILPCRAMAELTILRTTPCKHFTTSVTSNRMFESCITVNDITKRNFTKTFDVS